MKVKAIKSSRGIVKGETYNAIEIKNNTIKVVTRDYNAWRPLSDFKIARGKKLDRFVTSVEGKIFIEASYRRDIFADWAYLCRGTQNKANKIIKLVVRGDIEGLTKILGEDNLVDVKHYIDILKLSNSIKKDADLKYVWTVVNQKKPNR